MENIELETLVKHHHSFTEKLGGLLKTLLDCSDVKGYLFECRTKSVESLEEKIKRKKMPSPETSITDISGLRIIIYYKDDVDKVEKLIRDNFTVDEANSANKADLYKSNEFGYLSVHFVVYLNDKLKDIDEWKTFAYLKAEIQVRTVLQHAWASISHKLIYKKTYEAPQHLQRKLFQLAGLFEIADEQFLEMKKSELAYERSLEESRSIDAQRIDLNTVRYSFIAGENTVFEKLGELASQVGFDVRHRTSWSKDYTLSDLILASKLFSLTTIAELKKKLEESLDTYKVFLERLKRQASRSTWRGDLPFFSLLALISVMNRPQLDKFFDDSDWQDFMGRIVKQAALNAKLV
jgi:putative GTP pyrophosphokinase